MRIDERAREDERIDERARKKKPGLLFVWIDNSAYRHVMADVMMGIVRVALGWRSSNGNNCYGVCCVCMCVIGFWH